MFFGLFAIVPLVLVAVLSFMSWNGLGAPAFTGLANWTRLFHDPVMIDSLWLSVLLTVLGVAVQTPVSILLGVWAAGPQRNRAVLSAVYFVPLLLSATAVSVLWRALLDPNFGVPAHAAWLFGDGNLLGQPHRRDRRTGLRQRLAVHPAAHPDLPGRGPRGSPKSSTTPPRSTAPARYGSSSTSRCRSCATASSPR